jgi:signal transduction histidine kinase
LIPNALKVAFRRFSSIGITDGMTIPKRKQVRLVNHVALSMSLLALPYFFIFTHFNLHQAAFYVIHILVLYIISLILNYTHHSYIAGLIQIATQIMFLPFYSVYLGITSGAHLLLVPLSILPYMFFSHDDAKPYLRVSLGIIGLGMVFLWASHMFTLFTPVHIPLYVSRILYTCAFATTVFLVIIEAHIFSLGETRAFRTLMLSKNRQRALIKHADYARLVQNIAHEFKNPLQMLQSTADLKQMEAIDINEFCSSIQYSVERLNRIIQPMLSYMNPFDKYTFKICNLHTIATNVRNLCAIKCQSAGIQISVNCQALNPTIYADSHAVGQVLINLISNSISALAHEPHPSIQLIVTNQLAVLDNKEEMCVAISVHDNGCGMEIKNIEEISIPYESSRKTTLNVGLGMSIVAKTVHDHGGVLDISSEKNNGTTITCWFKCHDASSDAENSEPVT